MKTLSTLLRRTTPSVPTNLMHQNALIRTFVETGDERCPLAGIWMRLAESTSPTDDPELRLPAVGDSLWRRALYLRFTPLQYSTV
jgi:hypothetical protein